MSKCPYTWFKSLIGKSSGSANEAAELRVTVAKKGETIVDVSLPARSARWLLEVIPDEVIAKIRAEGILIDTIQADLAANPSLVPQAIFTLDEPERKVKVWLE